MNADDERYFERLESQLDEAFAVAETAREKGGDPTPEIEIPVAKDMADRVENILGIEGVADRVRELEGEMSREEAALELAADFAEGRVGDYETDAGKIEGAVRTAVALLTEGVVAAPIEGIDRVELATNPDGTEFVRVFYAGPIRSAGGTAQALSVLVADYTRALLGLAEYEAREEEVERYAEEVDLYDAETGLQYSPKDAETKFIARNSPVMLDGEATGQEEVSGFRDLERVGTNNPRGGMCLVLAEGIAQKAPKIERYTTDLDEVDWPWLDDLIAGTVGKTDDGDDADDSDADDAESETDGADDSDETGDEPESAADEDSEPDGPLRPEPSTKFLRDLIAGRPVFGHPSEAGGFRLRYGRARNHGFATAGVHPATMHLVDDFLATGTQLKTERPGKAAGVVPVDSIEGPTVRLANGDVRRIDDPETALELRNGVEAILDLGEYLVNYGEFVENNHPLAPASYTHEWWVQEFDATDANVQALADSTRTDLEHPTPEEAIEWAIEYDAPLHPEYTYCWHDLSVESFETLADAVAAGELVEGELALEPAPEVRDALEALLVPHNQAADALRIAEFRALVRSLGFDENCDRTWRSLSTDARAWPNAMKAAREVAPFALRERAPTRIGGRMGRPEKSEQRELSPAVHTLFPIGEAGGNQRDVSEAAEHVHDDVGERGVVPVQVGRRECTECGERSYETRCPDCGGVTEPRYECRDCEIAVEPDESGRAECPRCGSEATPTEWRTIDIREEFHDALDAVGERESAFDMVKGVKGLTSKLKTPEPMEKGVLRAKHGVSSFKDGTVRYDMTDLPVTSVRPAELDVSVDQFRELGYHEDIDGEPLRHADQLVELRVQDIVLSNGAAEHLLRTADFVDDLLERYYGLDTFYDFDDRDDLVGELVFGMAPHTSAAVVGRVVGFTSAAVGYAHPYFHASKRRNCDGDEDCVMLLMDGLLNFSKEYLPDKRGGRMDAPLVMSSRIDPAEIDDEAHNMDVVESYPKEFYEATLDMADPGSVDIEIAEESVGTEDEYSGFRHTHDTSNLALGPSLSAYKTLGAMTEKMDAQLELARKLRAVDETDVAERIIEYHFLPDLIGNLRAFSRQETRCLDCGTKYRRMPLTGECRECGGGVNLTVHEGSVEKYIDTATRVAEEYGTRDYTKQRLEVLDRTLESVFENDKNKQSGIADFM
ncbi:DNA polymerase II large subunit [Halococcus agarilyticus]|uniref:DNA polymerase II large subunit n=1 Tax=Halococcus agarilyticus TaxID=1232219 RepID=UPI000678060A|nr:DNA polymerase II large subunit [Halococcus agarilyticus]